MSIGTQRTAQNGPTKLCAIEELIAEKNALVLDHLDDQIATEKLAAELWSDREVRAEFACSREAFESYFFGMLRASGGSRST